MGKHFAFVVPPAHGHLNPTLPLVEELISRGHRVTVVTGQALAGQAARSGAAVVGLDWHLGTVSTQDGQYSTDSLVDVLEPYFDQVTATFPQLVEHFAADPVDLVCFDPMGYAGAALADKLGVRSITLCPSMAANEHVDLRKLWAPQDFTMDHPRLAAFWDKVARFSADQGLREELGAMGGPQTDLTLVFVPRDFQLRGETFAESFKFLGPSVRVRGRSRDWQPPADERPVLLISLGTAFNNRPEFFATCTEAFADSAWHVVMSVGEEVRLDSVPANFEVAAQVPQLAVLEHASVFVSHAGMGSTMESLHNGVPLVCVPQMAEQALNADRVQALGLGRVLGSTEVTAQELRKAVDEVAADPAIRAAVKDYSARLRAVDGPTLGADALEEYLSR
ncbi:macrolide family glycosyltransferase [Kutzneria albida]|uniref:Erythromycin biosynthesis protein CIII-like C-terminal domain-containing protein n=1 Tax=Kutzneria albida DSM 43870 TaxID=1449976 RepID=W5WHK8_9PSEU|nr:macrolide family glycosyltransferase [Kutzneria albida]AHH97629.1 hypothetical protein KALB_4267 [Kutzneria albida DSM 43870]